MNSIKEKVIGKHVNRFQEGDFDISDRECAGDPVACKGGRPGTAQALLDENSCRMEKQLAAQLGVTQQTISYRLKAMGKIRKGTTWVPHFLTQENQNSRRHMFESSQQATQKVFSVENYDLR